MKRVELLIMGFVLLVGVLPAFAQDSTIESDVSAWRRYVNNNLGFQVMLPQDWVIRDFGTTIEVDTLPDDPATAVLHISLTPVEFFEGGVIGDTPVVDLPLEDYASIALGYELGGPGTMNIEQVQPFQTDDGQTGYLATWTFAMTPLNDSGGTITPGDTENFTLRAAYFDLPEPEINGQTYRALEINTAGELPPETLDAILKSVVIGKLEPTDEFFAGLDDAVNTYLDQQGSTLTEAVVEPQIVDGDYVRFTLSTGSDAESDAALGFARKIGDSWEIIAVGTAFPPEFFTENTLPSSLQPVSTS